MTRELEATLLVDSQCLLAEGIQWNDSVQRLYWCDIQTGNLWSCDEDGGNVVSTKLADRIGSFAFDFHGDLLVAFADGFYRMKPNSGERELINRFEPDKPTTRLNDGRCDRQGRFVVGGMDELNQAPLSQVVVFDNGNIVPLISEISISNSICFSLDGKFMYFADSPTRMICRFAYDTKVGAVREKTVFAKLEEDDGVPDGSCIDADDAIWNARFGGAQVQRYLSNGSKDVRVIVPTSNVTCCCFGGKNLDRLYISTAMESLTSAQIREQKGPGGIFVVDPGLTGVTESRYGGKLFE